MKLLCGILFVILFAMLSGCGRETEVTATPTPMPTSAPLPSPTPSPVLALGQRRQGIIFHDLTQSEQECPGLAEVLAPAEITQDQISDSSMSVVRQVRVICTNDGKGTVYFIDLSKRTITATRKLPPIPGMP